MDWLQEYDRRDKEDCGAQRAEEQEEAFALDLPSSNTNNSIDNVCDCTLLNNLCDVSELAETRVGIGWISTTTPGAKGESSSIAEMHSRSPSFTK